MMISIRKTPISLHISYALTYSNNLSGRNIELGDENEFNLLSIDLEGNLRTRNKEENSYQDAEEFIRYHEKFNTLQILEFSVIEKLIRRYQKNTERKWKLELKFGFENTFLYDVEFAPSEYFLFFNNTK